MPACVLTAPLLAFVSRAFMSLPFAGWPSGKATSSPISSHTKEFTHARQFRHQGLPLVKAPVRVLIPELAVNQPKSPVAQHSTAVSIDAPGMFAHYKPASITGVKTSPD